MAGFTETNGTWSRITDGKSHYCDEIADPWIECELGLRVHDYVLDGMYGAGDGIGWDALDDLIYAEYCKKHENDPKM